jgi:hypothetical protein
MGLTTQPDIAILYEKIKQIEEDLLQQVSLLKKDIKKLSAVIFEGNVLLEKDESWDIVRKKRDYLLKSTDWTLTPGSSVDQSAWAAYRQILRDLPQTYLKSGVHSVRWPKTPSISGPNAPKKKSHLQ